MPYRDDLEAALAHAEAAERDLAAAREENQHDHQRIAELEKQLAAAQHKVGQTKKRAPPTKEKPKEKPKPSAPADPNQQSSSAATTIAVMFALLVVVAIIVGVALSSGNSGQKRVDVSGEIATATATAKRYFPDPVLKSISADYVDPAGVSDLAAFQGNVTYGFVSPSRTAIPEPPPIGPIGAPQPPVKYEDCAVEVRYRADSMRYYETPGRGAQTCGDPLTHPPRCRVTDVWTEAIRRGAPKNALARVRLEMRDYRAPGESRHTIPVWRFSISDQGSSVFDMELPDDCPTGGVN